jgi:RND family efflux transporter MFP subunit
MSTQASNQNLPIDTGIISSTRSAKSRPKFSQEEVGRLLFENVQSANNYAELLTGLAKVILDRSQCLALWAGQKPIHHDSKIAKSEIVDSNNWSFSKLTESNHVILSIVGDDLKILTDDAFASQATSLKFLDSDRQCSLVATPILTSLKQIDSPATVLIGCFDISCESELRQQWLLTMAAQAISTWRLRNQVNGQQAENKSLSSALSLMHRLGQTADLGDSARVMVNHLHRVLGCDQVVISFCSNHSDVKISAVSGVESVDQESEAAKKTTSALQQPLISGRMLKFSRHQEKTCTEDLALESYCQANNCEAALATPLLGVDEAVIGSLIVAGDSVKIMDEQLQHRTQQMLAIMSGQLGTVLRANRGLVEIFRSKFSRYWRAAKSKTIAAVLGIVLLAMLIPTPYRIPCECEIQPVLRRFVASPHDGILEQTLVDVGDSVTEGQVIARLDGRMLRVEKSGLQAEFEGARKRRDQALATNDIARSQIAKSEMQRYQSKIEILQQQLTNLEIRSPITGIVIVGDLEKAVGAPLEMGQTLFEVAPLNKMVAEVRIPEADFNYVTTAMPVKLKIDALPFETISGVIQRVHPSTEVIDDQSVFVADVVLDNSKGQLRPGMSGSAKINSGWSPTLWNLFHRPWESVRYWTVW